MSLRLLVVLHTLAQAKWPEADADDLAQNIFFLAKELDDRNEIASQVRSGLLFCEFHQLIVLQVGIQFIQVGDSTAARAYLEGLDDNLAKVAGAHGFAVRDIVDTLPYKGGQNLQKALLGAINRKIDKEKVRR